MIFFPLLVSTLPLFTDFYHYHHHHLHMARRRTDCRKRPFLSLSVLSEINTKKTGFFSGCSKTNLPLFHVYSIDLFIAQHVKGSVYTVLRQVCAHAIMAPIMIAVCLSDCRFYCLRLPEKDCSLLFLSLFLSLFARVCAITMNDE